MPDEKKDDSEFPLEFEVQSDEVRKNILAGAPAGLGTATGKERARLFDNADDDIPSGEDAGSKVPIAGGDSIRPDAEGPSEGAAGQLQPAIMTPSGSIPLGMIGTPSGPQPIGALNLTPQEAIKRLKEQAKTLQGRPPIHEGFARVPRSQIEGASAAGLRAAAADRSWDVGEGGARITRARFIKKQNEVFGEEGSEGKGDDAALTSSDPNVAMAAAAPEGYTWDASASRYILISG